MNLRSPVDLHLHSTASDGTLEPAALVAHVAGAGVRLMALTDHDTVAGVPAAAAAARVRGIAFVAGVELSASWRGRSIHVLGLALDPGNAVLARGLERQRSVRELRAERIADSRVQPYEQMTTAQQSNYMLERALITKAPDGSQPDPDVLKEVWGPHHVQETHYLRVFMASLRRKLEEDSAQPRYLVTEPGVGYRMASE